MTAFTFRDLAFVGGRRLLYPGYVQDYLDRVTAADVAAGNTLGLELSVTDAFNTCLQAMVAETSLGVSGGVLAQAASLIKASCAMQGARTLSGSLVPLAADMPAPTNVNFVAGDYNRRTGLGDPANVSKHLGSNYASNAAPQNSLHFSCYITTPATGQLSAYMANRFVDNSSEFNELQFQTISSLLVYNRNPDSSAGAVAGAGVTGLLGSSRGQSSSFIVRSSGANVTRNSTSLVPTVHSFTIFARNQSPVTLHSNARLNFYSIGESLDLAILDARITALSNAIQAAIAP